MRVAVACLAALVAQATLLAEAGACPSSSESESHLLGVDADGNFVEYYRSWGENADSESRGFIAYDKDGKKIASLSLGGFQPEPNDDSQPGADYFAEVVRAQLTDAKIIEADLIRAKRLEKPTARKMRHVKTEAQCGSLEIESKSGWLRVAEVGTLSYQFEGSCPTIHVEAFEHPKVNVTFVRAKYQLGSRPKGDEGYGTYEENDAVHHLPNSRIEAAELWLLGERARLDRNLAKAIPMIERSIRLAPEYMPARSSLIRAYSKEGRSWESLLELLEAEVPAGVAKIGPEPSEALLKALPTMWQEAADREDGFRWAASSYPFSESFI